MKFNAEYNKVVEENEKLKKDLIKLSDKLKTSDKKLKSFEAPANYSAKISGKYKDIKIVGTRILYLLTEAYPLGHE
jgi:hypothetical protein